MENPLKSEAVAFRWLIAVLPGAAVVIVAGVLISRPVGAAIALALLAAGVAYVIRGLRSGGEDLPVTRGGDGRYRLLVLADEELQSPELREQSLSLTGGRAEIRVVVPARPGGGAAAEPGGSEETELARQRMELAVIDLRQAGREVEGRLGDADPRAALHEALSGFPADAILVATPAAGTPARIDAGLAGELRGELSLPLWHVVSGCAE